MKKEFEKQPAQQTSLPKITAGPSSSVQAEEPDSDDTSRGMQSFLTWPEIPKRKKETKYRAYALCRLITDVAGYCRGKGNEKEGGKKSEGRKKEAKRRKKSGG